MPRLLILLFCCCITYFTQAQDAKELLKKCFEKCQAINNGHFVSTVAHKSELYPENVSKSNVTFRKTNNDTVSPCLFYAQFFLKGDVNRYTLYTGKEYASYSSVGDFGEIVPNDKYATDALTKCRSDIYQSFEPFMMKNSFPLPKYSDFESQSTNYKFINIESVNGFKCWHVQTTRTIKNDSTQLIKYNKYTNEYWINMSDTIPVQYLLASESLVDRDTRIYYKKVAVESYELDNITSDALFKLTVIPK